MAIDLFFYESCDLLYFDYMDRKIRKFREISFRKYSGLPEIGIICGYDCSPLYNELYSGNFFIKNSFGLLIIF